MAVSANTIETYDNMVIREDLQEAYSMISPEECPFQTMCGTGDADNTYFEWPLVELAAPDVGNRVMEGEDDPDEDEGTLADRRGNYTQISDKVVKVSHTSEQVDAAAEDIQKLATQVSIKIREMKRDMEVMFMADVPAAAGSSGTPRVSAGFPTFLFTNTDAGAGGVDPGLSAAPNGYPSGAAMAGTPRGLSEAMFNDNIQACWEAGANPTVTLVTATYKRIISENFTGASTRYKDSIDKTIVNAIDIYDGDFGQQTIVPTRFMVPPGEADPGFVFNIDPDFLRIKWLETIRQKPLAETGHSKSRLVWGEYGLQVDNEAAHGIIRDLDGTFAPPA